MRRRSPPRGTGMSALRRDPPTIQSDPPRRKPDYCLNLGITWAGMLALELRDRLPTLAFKSFGAFVAGAAKRAELVGDVGPERAAKLDRRFRIGKRSRSPHLACARPGGADDLHATASPLCSAQGGAFREVWRRDGMALMETRDGQADSHDQGPLRIYRRDQHDHAFAAGRNITRRIISSPANPRCLF